MVKTEEKEGMGGADGGLVYSVAGGDPAIQGGLGAPNGAELNQTEQHEHPGIPMPPPLLSPNMMQVEQHGEGTPHPLNEAMAAAMDDDAEDITITDQDVLFGRGGLTNRHIGNLRYRDVISIHRQDYVSAHKTEKPNVARRIVKAIKTGEKPGRFLRKGEDGRWHEVSDKEAAWKASQALREKSRWSSMKQEREEQSQNATASAAVLFGEATVDSAAVQKAVAKPEPTKKAAKRKAAVDAEGSNGKQSAKKVKSKASSSAAAAKQPPEVSMPTEVSHITIPSIVSKGGRKVILPPNAMVDSVWIILPNEEDVLFGRGGRTNHHPGNKRLRDIVNKYRDVYHSATKTDKPLVSRLIVTALRNADPPSRFLRKNDETTRWEDVGDKRAAEKVSQTLREKDKHAKDEYLAMKGKVDVTEEEEGEEVVSPLRGGGEALAVPEEMQVDVSELPPIQMPASFLSPDKSMGYVYI